MREPALPVIHGPAVNVAKVERMLAYLDANDARYSDLGDGWFEALWFDPSVGEPGRFATNARILPREADFAHAFEARARNT